MARALDPSPASIGRYEVLRRIGRGGMAEVFLGRAVGPGGVAKRLCLKRLLPSRALDPRALERFLDEARTALDLQHANIVPVFDFGRDDDGLFLVMEWIDGCDLAALIRERQARGEPVPVVVAAFVASEVAKALAYAHGRRDAAGRAAGGLHRDVTPRNILLSRLGEVRIADFGIARALGREGLVAGTPAYMAPEQARGEPSDSRSDLYSLGLVLGEMLLGHRLRNDDSLAAAQVAVDTSPLAEMPGEVAAVARRMLAPGPDSRFPTAEAVERALATALASDVLLGGEPPEVLLAHLVERAAPLPAADEPDGAAPVTLAPPTIDAETTQRADTGSSRPRAQRRRPIYAVATAAVLLLAVSLALLAVRLAGDTPAAARPTQTLAAPPTPQSPPGAPAPAVAAPVGAEPALSTRRQSARLRITAPGSWVAVYLDGHKLADDVGVFEISSGRHTLRVENPPLGFIRNEVIDARPGRTVKREFRPGR